METETPTFNPVIGIAFIAIIVLMAVLVILHTRNHPATPTIHYKYSQPTTQPYMPYSTPYSSLPLPTRSSAPTAPPAFITITFKPSVTQAEANTLITTYGATMSSWHPAQTIDYVQVTNGNARSAYIMLTTSPFFIPDPTSQMTSDNTYSITVTENPDHTSQEAQHYIASYPYLSLAGSTTVPATEIVTVPANTASQSIAQLQKDSLIQSVTQNPG